MNKIQDAFQQVTANENLKDSTREYIFTEQQKRLHHRGIQPQYRYALCSFLTMVIIFIGGWSAYSVYMTPVSFISIDVNPSVELSLNRFDKVISATAYNSDGEKILQNVSLKGMPYTEAINTLLSDDTFDDYLTDDSLLTFTVVSDDEAAIIEGIQTSCKNHQQAEVCEHFESEQMDEAHENGLSFGKYRAYLVLSQYAPEITAKDCQSLSMREIQNLIIEHGGPSDSMCPDAITTNDEEEHNGKGNQNSKRNQNGNSGQHSNSEQNKNCESKDRSKHNENSGHEKGKH